MRSDDLAKVLSVIEGPALRQNSQTVASRVMDGSKVETHALTPVGQQVGRKLENIFARCLTDQLLSGSKLSPAHKAVGLQGWNHLVAETLANAISASGTLDLARRLEVSGPPTQGISHLIPLRRSSNG